MCKQQPSILCIGDTRWQFTPSHNLIDLISANCTEYNLSPHAMYAFVKGMLIYVIIWKKLQCCPYLHNFHCICNFGTWEEINKKDYRERATIICEKHCIPSLIFRSKLLTLRCCYANNTLIMYYIMRNNKPFL